MMRFSMSTYSSIGKKIFMGLTGLSLCGFIVVHLIGNLALLNPDPDPFNKYSHFLTHQLGSLIYVAEAILAAVFLIHFIYAIIVTIDNWRARPQGYKVVTNANHTSRKNIASTTMIWTGAVIIIFLVWHLLHFKYGEMITTTTADGQVLRDLYSLVYMFYGNIVNVVLYVLVMSLLGFHLYHGFWSAFQSLGLNGKRFTPFIYVVGSIFAVVMAVGFIFLPLWIFVQTGGLS
jgi:succinate dehydrogenase / fumarate reductase cytochrome b subunit